MSSRATLEALEADTRRAHLELDGAPFAELMTLAMGELSLSLAGAGYVVNDAKVCPSFFVVPGMAGRRMMAVLSTAGDPAAQGFGIAVLLTADLRSTGDTPLSLVLQYEASDCHGLMFVRDAPAVAPLNAERGLTTACQALWDGWVRGRFAGKASLFCLQLNEAVTP